MDYLVTDDNQFAMYTKYTHGLRFVSLFCGFILAYITVFSAFTSLTLDWSCYGSNVSEVPLKTWVNKAKESNDNNHQITTEPPA